MPSDGAAPSDLPAQEDGAGPRAVSVAFGRRLRELRRAADMSQDDLARATGIHATAIGRYERGVREPRVAMILHLAHGLGVPPGGRSRPGGCLDVGDLPPPGLPASGDLVHIREQDEQDPLFSLPFPGFAGGGIVDFVQERASAERRRGRLRLPDRQRRA